MFGDCDCCSAVGRIGFVNFFNLHVCFQSNKPHPALSSFLTESQISCLFFFVRRKVFFAVLNNTTIWSVLANFIFSVREILSETCQ